MKESASDFKTSLYFLFPLQEQSKECKPKTHSHKKKKKKMMKSHKQSHGSEREPNKHNLHLKTNPNSSTFSPRRNKKEESE
jgi:hypothetical protein